MLKMISGLVAVVRMWILGKGRSAKASQPRRVPTRRTRRTPNWAVELSKLTAAARAASVSCQAFSETWADACPECVHEGWHDASFVAGDRVRRKDGAIGEGTVTEQSAAPTQYLVVKWDTADLPQCESHLDLCSVESGGPFAVGELDHCVFCVSGCSMCAPVESKSPPEKPKTGRSACQECGSQWVHWPASGGHKLDCSEGHTCGKPFNVGDRVRRKTYLGSAAGVVTRCWPRHLTIKWDGGLGTQMWDKDKVEQINHKDRQVSVVAKQDDDKGPSFTVGDMQSVPAMGEQCQKGEIEMLGRWGDGAVREFLVSWDVHASS